MTDKLPKGEARKIIMKHHGSGKTTVEVGSLAGVDASYVGRIWRDHDAPTVLQISRMRRGYNMGTGTMFNVLTQLTNEEMEWMYKEAETLGISLPVLVASVIRDAAAPPEPEISAWQLTSSPPNHFTSCMVFLCQDFGGTLITTATLFQGKWMSCGEQVFPSHWMPLPNEPEKELTEKPSIDWDQVPAEFNAMATDRGTTTWLYEKAPTLGINTWWEVGLEHPAHYFSSFTPGTCDWKDSLVLRPGYTETKP
jgi:hypothetical protein